MQGKRTNLTKVIFTKIYKYGLSPVIFALALFFGLVAINYVVAVKTPYYDITRNKVNSLSGETVNLLDQITFNVSVKAFYLASGQRQITQLLGKYSQQNPQIKVEFIDPIKMPVIAEQYEVTLPGTIIFETAGKKSRINPSTARRSHGEREVTIALYRLLTEETKKAYFTSGHGELSLTNVKRDGISTIQERLEEQNYIVETINLIEKNEVPKDCSVLVIAGPSVPFTQDEMGMVMKYLDSGGSAMIMIGPGSKSGLEPIIQAYGILPGNDYVYETSRSLTTQAGGPLAPLCAAQDTSEITNKLENQNFLFPFVRSMTRAFPMERMSLRRLVASSSDSWAETDLESARTVNTNAKPSRDEKELKGPVTVAVTAERELDLPDSVATRTNPTYKVRSAFYGNATFISNEMVTLFPQNMNLFLNTVNWITKNEKIIEITPHTVAFTPIELKDSDRRMITWVTLVLIPFAIIMAGIVVWYRRR
ncbi:MAG: GldG family protein [Candidatus Latescibacterota bacterium]